MKDSIADFAERSLADVADAFPQSISVFGEAGIDFSCKGLRSIADAALAAGYEVEELRALIEAAPQPENANQWSQRPLDELTRFLIADHHDFTANLVPHVKAVIAAMIDRHPSVAGFRRVAKMFTRVCASMTLHTTHEERDLFATFCANGPGPRDVAKTRLSQRVLREFVEHESFSEHFRSMQEICLRIPDEVSVELMEELDRLTRTVHYHMHLENNILYPRAIALENELQFAT